MQTDILSSRPKHPVTLSIRTASRIWYTCLQLELHEISIMNIVGCFFCLFDFFFWLVGWLVGYFCFVLLGFTGRVELPTLILQVKNFWGSFSENDYTISKKKITVKYIDFLVLKCISLKSCSTSVCYNTNWLVVLSMRIYLFGQVIKLWKLLFAYVQRSFNRISIYLIWYLPTSLPCPSTNNLLSYRLVYSTQRMKPLDSLLALQEVMGTQLFP